MSRRPILTTLTALALASSVALLAGAASSEPPHGSERGTPAWGPVRKLATNPPSASVAVDGHGTATVAWTTSTPPGQVVARQRFADGSWGEQTVLGSGGSPRVVADRRGVATVVWTFQREGHSDGVAAAQRTQTGEWSAPVTLAGDQAGPVLYRAAGLDVAANRKGDLVLAWRWGDETGARPTRIQSVFRSADGPWATAVDVTAANGADEPVVGIAADGIATVVYGVQAFGEPQALVARVRAGGTWGHARRVAAEGYEHDLAVAGDGRAVVVFTPDFSTARVKTRTAGGSWGRARTLVQGGELNDTDVAVNRKGHFVVGVARPRGRIHVAERGAKGGWSGPVRLAKGGTVAGEVVVAIDAAGDTFVGWGDYGVYGRYRPRGGAWGPRSTAWPDAGVDVLEALSAVMAPSGDVAVLWDQEESYLRMRVLLTP